jgi:transcriptional regulator with XRE-family HTH domain
MPRKRRRADKEATRQRRAAVPLELYAGDTVNTDRSLALYGPLAREVGRKLKAFREAAGWSLSKAAAAMGLKGTDYRRMEQGRIIMSAELQRRAICVFFKRLDWRTAPTMPALRPSEAVYVAKDEKSVQIRWFDLDLWRRMQRFAVTNGVSQASVIAVALERFLLDEPALMTVQAALAVAEKLRTESILAANPDLVYLLKGDPQVVKLAMLTKEAPAEHYATIKDWNPLWDGPATPIAGDELRAGMLAPAKSEDT